MNVIGIFCAQPAHLAHVLLAAHRMDHRARSEEQAGLEERMRHQVKDARGVRADADADEHVAELADGPVREHLLDVGLGNADVAANSAVSAPTVATTIVAGASEKSKFSRATM